MTTMQFISVTTAYTFGYICGAVSMILLISLSKYIRERLFKNNKNYEN